MSKFSDWFTKEYRRWNRTQPGEENFLAFCSQLGYTPETVLAWMSGGALPQNGEVLSIAGFFGPAVYSVLGLAEPDPALLDSFAPFAQLPGEQRSLAARALYEADLEIKERRLEARSEEARSILIASFEKYGFDISRDNGTSG